MFLITVVFNQMSNWFAVATIQQKWQMDGNSCFGWYRQQ